MPMDFLNRFNEVTGNNYAARGETVNDNRTTIDTSSYILNGLLSGSIFGGASSNGVTALAGDEATGKCARGTEKIVVYMTPETRQKLGV